MLVLKRELNETIWIGNDIVITICRINRHNVKVGIVAPEHVQVWRGEIADERKRKENSNGDVEND